MFAIKFSVFLLYYFVGRKQFVHDLHDYHFILTTFTQLPLGTRAAVNSKFVLLRRSLDYELSSLLKQMVQTSWNFPKIWALPISISELTREGREVALFRYKAYSSSRSLLSTKKRKLLQKRCTKTNRNICKTTLFHNDPNAPKLCLVVHEEILALLSLIRL